MLNRSLALLYVDLDQFKRINDTWATRPGMRCLRQVAETLRAGLDLEGEDDEPLVPPNPADPPQVRARARGQLARVGGDEFIVVLTGRTDAAQAQRAARRDPVDSVRAVSAGKL